MDGIVESEPPPCRPFLTMAKTYKNLFPGLYNFKSLHRAYMKASRMKRYRAQVLQFRQNLERNLLQLQNELINKTYHTGEYRTFFVYEPKARLVATLPFRDRVVQHALCTVIEPIWERRFIYDSYACRISKGMHAGADRTQDFLRAAQRKWGKSYCLKGDILKYFPNIDHGVLKSLIRKRIACPDTLWLCDEIIDSAKQLNESSAKGIPIGNFTSQLFANIYLHELDKMIKHDLREPFYVRYMDDFVIIGSDKAHLHTVREHIAYFLKEHLLLELNSKTQVFPAKSRGIDFLGYRIWPTHRLLRNSTKKRICRALKIFSKSYSQRTISAKDINARVQSWLGHMKHCNSYRLRKKLFDAFVLSRKVG